MKIKKEIQRGIIKQVIKCFEKDMKRKANPMEVWIIENSVAISLKIVKKKDVVAQ